MSGAGASASEKRVDEIIGRGAIKALRQSFACLELATDTECMRTKTCLLLRMRRVQREQNVDGKNALFCDEIDGASVFADDERHAPCSKPMITFVCAGCNRTPIADQNVAAIIVLRMDGEKLTMCLDAQTDTALIRLKV